MRELHFKVNGQTLTKDGDFSSLVRGTKGYLQCHILPDDSDWSSATIAVVFTAHGTEYPVAVDKKRCCYIPDEVAACKTFTVKLYGATGRSKISTNAVLVTQR